MTSGKSTGETTGYAQSDAARQKTDAATGQVNQNLSQFNGPVQQTPYYKALFKQGTDSTNQAYDNASRNLKMSMESAGVPGSSGASAGNLGAMRSQRAGALGQVGTGATEGATNMQMQANQQLLNEAGMYSGAGLGYFGGANQAEMERLKNQGSMFTGLLQAGMGGLSNLDTTGGSTFGEQMLNFAGGMA